MRRTEPLHGTCKCCRKDWNISRTRFNEDLVLFGEYVCPNCRKKVKK